MPRVPMKSFLAVAAKDEWGGGGVRGGRLPAHLRVVASGGARAGREAAARRKGGTGRKSSRGEEIE